MCLSQSTCRYIDAAVHIGNRYAGRDNGGQRTYRTIPGEIYTAGKSKVVNIGRQGAYKRGGTSVSDGMPITVKGNIQGTQGVTLFQSYIGFQQNLSIPGPVVQTSQRFIRILEFRPIRCRSNPPAHRSKGCFCYSIGKIDPFSPVQGNGVGFGNGSRSAVLEKEFESKTG